MNQLESDDVQARDVSSDWSKMWVFTMIRPGVLGDVDSFRNENTLSATSDGAPTMQW